MASYSLRKRQTILHEKKVQKPPLPSVEDTEGLHNPKVRGTTAAAGEARKLSRAAMRGRSISHTVHDRGASLAGIEEVTAGGHEADYSVDTILLAQLDPTLLNANEFDAQAYLSDLLTKASPADVENYAEHLANQMQQVVQEESRTVQRNYERILQVAKEMTALAPDASSLRRLVNDLRLVGDALRTDAEMQLNAGKVKSHKKTASQVSNASDSGILNNRNSVLVLNNAWAQDLHSLFRRIEGLQKYLPQITGRHLVLESAGWYELNPVTWQPHKSVVLVVLNDHLVVAVKNRTRGLVNDESGAGLDGASSGLSNPAGGRQLSVDHCWSLEYLQLQELSMAANVGPAIEVTVGGVPTIYRAESNSAKHSVVSEVQKAQRALLDSGPPGLMSPSPSWTGLNTVISDLPGQTQENDEEATMASQYLISSIDMAMAQRQYGKATRLCLEAGTPVASLTAQLKQLLYERLWRQNEVLDTIKLLCQLGEASGARQKYLEVRHAHIVKTVQKVRCVDDVVLYISQMAVIYVQLVLATVKVYQQAFTQESDSSVLVKWARNEILEFRDVLERQLVKLNKRSRTILQCIDITKREIGQLGKLGLNMDFVLESVYKLLG